MLQHRLLQAAREMRSAAAAQPRQFVRAVAVAAVLLGYAIHLGTLAHPFLLADNRRALAQGPWNPTPAHPFLLACWLGEACPGSGSLGQRAQSIQSYLGFLAHPFLLANSR